MAQPSTVSCIFLRLSKKEKEAKAKALNANPSDRNMRVESRDLSEKESDKNSIRKDGDTRWNEGTLRA